jgi:hypothetical protein
MNSSKFSVRAALAVVGTLFGALALPAISQAGSVALNGTQVCTSAPSMSMDPAGNLVITCTATGTGTPTNPPSCSVIPQTITAGAGVMATMSASCTNTPTSFSWTSTAPGFVAANAGSVTAGPLTVAGSYSFTVTASNAAGAGAAATGTLTVNAAPPGGGGGGSCATPTAQVVANFTGLTWVELTIQQGGAVAVALPQNTQGMVTELRSIQSTNTSTDLTDEIAISTCPGEFNVPAECKTWGTVFGSATYMRGYTTATPTTDICSMTPGVQYYASVRNTKFDRVTPSCTTTTCNMKLQYNSY